MLYVVKNNLVHAGVALVVLIGLSAGLIVLFDIHIPHEAPLQSIGFGVGGLVALGCWDLGIRGVLLKRGHHVYLRWAAPLRIVYRDIGGWHIVLAALVAGVGEELFFRGLLQTGLSSFSLLGIWGAMVLQAVLFGALHYAKGLTREAGLAVIQGFFIGLIYWASGSLVATMIAHAGHDALAMAYLRYRFPDEKHWEPQAA